MDLSYLQAIFEAQGLTTAQTEAIEDAIRKQALQVTLPRCHDDTFILTPVKTDPEITFIEPRNPSQTDTELNDAIEQDTSNATNDPPTTNTLFLSHFDRYEDLGFLGNGAMGEVRRVLDKKLKRSLAMKIIHPHMLHLDSVVARFIEEGQVGAQLQHPGLVPVHDLGKLPDGRLYFTMQEIRGREFSKVIKSVHASIKDGQWQPTKDGWNFHRLIDAFHQVCNAVAYAHSVGVVHRDLKPHNIMIGSFGEVHVVDWGIAKIKGHSDRAVEDGDLNVVSTNRSKDGSYATRMGQIAGTPAYMAPEQARGEIQKIDVRSDVYSLGAILYELLSGDPPYKNTSGFHLLEQVKAGSPTPLQGNLPQKTFQADDTIEFVMLPDLDVLPSTKPALPEELIEVCEKAMARNQAHRYQSAHTLAQAIEAWMDGARKRDQALKVVEEALRTEREAEELRNHAKELRAMAAKEQKDIFSWESEKRKTQLWNIEDNAAVLEQQADLLTVVVEQRLQAALSHKADLPEAHAKLASKYRKMHQYTESIRDKSQAQQAELRLEEHANALPADHPDRKSHFTYLRGKGALSLVTDVPGAQVVLEKYEMQNRRLVPKAIKHLGVTPLYDIPMEMGSYRLRIQKHGYHEVLYPVYIGRSEHWNGISPSSKSRNPYPIWLPPLGAIEDEDCYIPAGWFWSGGDPKSTTSLPRQRIWIDGLIMQKFQVRHRDYIHFLDDLVAQGRGEEALKYAPRERAGQAGQQGALLYGQKKDGRFQLVPDVDGDLWNPDWPVFMIDWYGAMAYGKWKVEQSGLPWRLPWELEWEKGARGVDGRFCPWGDGFDPSWCCMRESHQNRALPAVINSYPIDESPYGVRGMAGNMMDWTASIYRKNGPRIVNGKPIHNTAMQTDDSSGRIYRGGSWFFDAGHTRAAKRLHSIPKYRLASFGFRICRSIHP